jgi:solute carrier family 25 uncoupling protein 8/9
LRWLQKQYSGMLDCFRKTYAREGALAFYNGFLPNFARLGSWNVVMFLSLEKVRKLYLDNVAAAH